jgi:hypothetical protein
MKEEKNQSEEKVEMTRAELTSLLKRLEKVENPGVIDLDEPTQHFCKVRLFDNKPISRVFDVKCSGKDPITEDEIMECKLEVIGEDDKVEVVKADYLDMIRNFPTVQGEIVKVDEKDISITQGKVAVNQVEGYNTISTGIMVPLKVKMVESTFVVKLPEGREVRLKTINI